MGKTKAKKDKKHTQGKQETEETKSLDVNQAQAMQLPGTEDIIKNTIIGVMSNPEFSKVVGVSTGANIAVVLDGVKEIKEGKASQQTIATLLQNLGGAIIGYQGAKQELDRKKGD